MPGGSPVHAGHLSLTSVELDGWEIDSNSCKNAEMLQSQMQHLKAELVATAAAHEEEETRLAQVNLTYLLHVHVCEANV